MLRRKAMLWIAVFVAVAVIVVSLFSVTSQFSSPKLASDFFVGVEFGYSYGNGTDQSVMINDVKAVVDRVKNFTNLFVLGTPHLTYNETTLTEACDYIRDSGLYFIVLLTGRDSYNGVNQPIDWIVQAVPRYGDKLLGIYRYDEPGGSQLDQGRSKFFTAENRSMYGNNYSGLAADWSYYLGAHIEAYANATDKGVRVHVPLFTADYGLYWFDYAAGYNAVFAEYGMNHSRQLNTALCRGGATAFGKDWGAIIAWTYDCPPYIESADAMYSDLADAYCQGAKYAVVFDHPRNESCAYGVLSDAHFAALERFWKDIHGGSGGLASESAKVAYVLPAGYGFGFRRADDTIWGLWSADSLSAKVWGDVNTLIARYGFGFDVVYDYPQFSEAYRSRYSTLFFWNQTIT